MDVTPQVLHDVEFREAKRGGYNTQDVDEFLERLAVGIERHDAQLREARQRIETAEARAAEAERRATETRESNDIDETLKRTLVLAQRTADAAIREAEEEAARTLASAQEQATRLLTDAEETSARARAEAEVEAREAQEEARARVLAELRELEAARDILANDVQVLELHLTDQRRRLQTAATDLQQLLDDPARLGEVPVPTVNPVEVASEEPAAAPSRTGSAPADQPEAAAAAREDPSAWQPDDDAWATGAEDREPPPRSPAYADTESGDERATEAVDMLAAREADDDDYLAELRKAMTDESPLGPREDDEAASEAVDRGQSGTRSRFGRRR